MDYRIISIGAMSAHPLWGEKSATRSGHATTTLIVSGKSTILVDPGLPEPAITARLGERANLAPTDITDVVLTCFSPECRRGLAAFGKARWLISTEEREAVGVQLASALKDLYTRKEEQGGVRKEEELREILEQDVLVLQRCEPLPQNLAPRVDAFPLAGVTPGLCGLLLSGPRFTIVVAGDAIPTREHLEQGKVLATGDLDRARASFEEAVEVADFIIPGRDNLCVNPTKRPF